MLLEIGLIVGGIPVGYALRKSSFAVTTTGHALSAVIYALLFVIGLNLGNDESLLLRLADLGVQGVLIGILSALGSVFAICFLFRSLFPAMPSTTAQSGAVKNAATEPESSSLSNSVSDSTPESTINSLDTSHAPSCPHTTKKEQ